MNTPRTISVREFKKLLDGAGAISLDYGALLTKWRSDEVCLLEAAETDPEGNLWEYHIPMDKNLEITLEDDTFVAEWDGPDNNSPVYIQLYKVTPITTEEG